MKKNLVVSSVVTRNPRDLKQHILNIELYGEDLPAPLKASIEQYGIREAIRVCRSSNPKMNDMIVSGRRRRNIAIELNLKEVPTVEWPCEDELELEEELILANVRAELTNEQLIRQFDKLKAIAAVRAEKRMKSGKKSDPTATSPEGAPEEKGSAADIAAKQVGMGRKKAEAGAKVVEKIDKLKAEGKTEEAASLTKELNTSVHRAARKASAVAPPVPRGRQTCQHCDTICDLSHKFCHSCGQELPARPDPMQASLPKDKYTKAIEVGVRKVTEHLNLYRSHRVKLIKAVDDKHLAHPNFGKRHKQFEAILTTMGEGSEFLENAINSLNEQWAKAREALGDN